MEFHLNSNPDFMHLPHLAEMHALWFGFRKFKTNLKRQLVDPVEAQLKFTFNVGHRFS